MEVSWTELEPYIAIAPPTPVCLSSAGEAGAGEFARAGVMKQPRVSAAPGNTQRAASMEKESGFARNSARQGPRVEDGGVDDADGATIFSEDASAALQGERREMATAGDRW